MSTHVKSRSNMEKVLHRFFSRKIAVLGTVLVILIILFAVFGSSVARYTYDDANTADRYQEPGSDHWFGTDDLGRDIFARVVDGAGITLEVAFGSSLVALVFGTVLGLISGYFGGLFDEVLSGFMNSLWALPTIVLAMAISAQAINQQKTLAHKTPVGDNPAFTFRTFLLRLGLIGPEYKNVREHLLKNLPGDRAWRYDKAQYPCNQRHRDDGAR